MPGMLWVVCLDDRAFKALNDLGNPRLRTIPLTDVETPNLLAVKPERSRKEYAWTLTPFTPRAVFERDASVKRVTYVDADLFSRVRGQSLMSLRPRARASLSPNMHMTRNTTNPPPVVVSASSS